MLKSSKLNIEYHSSHSPIVYVLSENDYVYRN